jgi:hypothetical protein
LCASHRYMALLIEGALAHRLPAEYVALAPPVSVGRGNRRPPWLPAPRSTGARRAEKRTPIACSAAILRCHPPVLRELSGFGGAWVPYRDDPATC